MKVIRIKQNENGKWTIEGIDNITDLINYEKSKAKELNDEELLYGELRDEELLDSYFEQDLKKERELQAKENLKNSQNEFKKEFENTFIKILKEHEIKKLEEEEVKKKIFIENEKKSKRQQEPVVFSNEAVKITREQPVKITTDVKENHPEKAIIANAKKMSKYIERAEGEIKVLNDRIKKLTNTVDKYAELQLEIKNIIDMYKKGMINTEFVINRLLEVQRIYNR